ncbi:MAG: tripartite tricarboxylate transporter permease [Betaproteobacteria bacterium]|nr:tripartite tricarboxylate transporter permease [Betaproteobacteria bacterium]
MDVINGIISVLTPELLLYSFAGCVLGTLVGVLPGLGPAATMAILLPITMNLQNPTGAIIMLAGLYYGAAYGGSTTSILTNIPGEVSSIPTCFDGFPMTKQGRAGEALWIAAVGSFIAGTIGTIVLSIVGPGFAKVALSFGPPEYFGLLFFSLTAIIGLSGDSVIKGLAVGILGMILATIGADPVSGTMRFSFGLVSLTRGLDLIPVAVGLFGIGEILVSSEAGMRKIYEGTLGKMMPRGNELKKGLGACIRGTALGLPLGMLPGMTPPVASFMAYDLEKRISKYPEKFGTGVIEGVAGPEAANNANAQAGFIPLMAFGIPTGPSAALILAALMIYGLQPGPMLFVTNKEFAWTVIGSMYVGNVMLLILNLPLVGLWARISTIPYKYLAPVILAVCVVAAYSSRNTMFDVWVAVGAGVIGYFMKKSQWPVGPVILGFILGPMIEVALDQSLNMGGPMILFSRPISAALLLLAVIVVLSAIFLRRRVPREVLTEDS